MRCIAAVLLCLAAGAVGEPGLCGSAMDKCGVDVSGFSLCCQNSQAGTHVCCSGGTKCSCQPGHVNCQCVRTLDNVNGSAAAPAVVAAVQALPGQCGSADDKCGQNAQGFPACCQNTPSTHVCCDQYHHCACQPGNTNCACYRNSAAADSVNGNVPAPAGGCRKGSCPFSYTNPANVSGGRCGEVDASSRMPDDIWAYPDKVAEYVNLTIMLYKFGVVGAGTLVNAPCPRKGWYQKGYQIAAWDTPETMKVVCKIHCHCDWPACQDAPDDPKAGNFCSLCGPKFEAPINIAFWYPNHVNASEV